VSRKTLRFARESALRTNPALSASSLSPQHPTALTLHRSFEQDHNTSRKLLDPLIALLRIPSPKHRQPTAITTYHREKYPSGYSPSTSIPWQASSSPTEPRHHRALLITDPVRHRSSLSTRSPPQPRLPQGLP
jgi:hypothetical protein